MAEATAAAGSFIYREDAEEEGLQVQSLRDYVVAIPTMNAIHGQDTWRARHVSNEYADHSAWDVHTIIEILRKFFNASEGTSLPELAEYNWRLDKVTNFCCCCSSCSCYAPAPPLPPPPPPPPPPPVTRNMFEVTALLQLVEHQVAWRGIAPFCCCFFVLFTFCICCC